MTFAPSPASMFFKRSDVSGVADCVCLHAKDISCRVFKTMLKRWIVCKEFIFVYDFNPAGKKSFFVRGIDSSRYELRSCCVAVS